MAAANVFVSYAASVVKIAVWELRCSGFLRSE